MGNLWGRLPIWFRVLIALFVVGLIASPFVEAPSTPVTAGRSSAPPEKSDAAATTALVPVVDVVDGDTIKVLDDGHKTTIRIIGMDTPETKHPTKPVQCFGPQASRRADQLLAGRRVRLEFDTSQGRFDRYGRTLAYVRLANGELFEQIMIAEGYAHEYTYNRAYRYQVAFRRAEATARDHQRGFWSPSTCDGDTDQPAD